MRELINLMPAARLERRRQKHAADAWSGSLAIAIAAAVAAVGMLRFQPHRAAARETQSELATLESKLAACDDRIASSEAELHRLQSSLSIARQLEGRPDWSLLLLAIARAAGDDVVLERMGLERPRETEVLRVTISGLAQDHGGSNEFLLALERVGVFENIHLVQTSRRETSFGDLIRFEIVATLMREATP